MEFGESTEDFQKSSTTGVCDPDISGNTVLQKLWNKRNKHKKQLSFQGPFHINPSVSTAYSELISTLSTNDLIPSLNFENDD